MTPTVTTLLLLLLILPTINEGDHRADLSRGVRRVRAATSLRIGTSLRAAKREPNDQGSLRDSVRVIIFASRRLHEVRVSSSSGLLRDGERNAGTMTIACDGDQLLTGKRNRSSVVVASGGPRTNLDIVGDGVTRRVRGRVRFEAEGGYLRIVATIPIRDYLASTLASETLRNDPTEYLVAMARLQRNYLLAHKDRHAPEADICDNTHCQRSDMTDVRGRTYMAVDRGEQLMLEAEGTYPCYYSVNCGGSTLTPSQIWNHVEPGYSNVLCTHCRSSERFRWGRSIPSSPEADRILRRAPRTPFVADDFKIQLGRVVGFNRILSNTIDKIERRGKLGWRIYGRGFGHRVGLCQEGAVTLARNRWRAAAILRFYFPRATVRSSE